MAGTVAKCQVPICAKLRAEQAKLKRFREVDSEAAKGAYEPLASRKPPAGFRNATDADLADLNLKRSFLEHPIDPATGKPSDFNAAVFVNDKTGERLIAYKGTTPTSLEDWKNNLQQGTGQPSFYYTRAQEIATTAASSPKGQNVRFTGHSLGGGLASAAARATGKDATTFNAAGLKPSTVREVVPGGHIDAVYVRGEILTSVQNLGLPKAASDKTWPLDPPRGYGKWLVTGGAIFGAKGVAAALLARSVGLHMMGSVDRSLNERRDAVDKQIKANGC